MSFNAVIAVGATLVAVLSATGAVWMIFSAFADAERTRASAGWSAVHGTVVASQLDTFWSDTGGRTYIPSITYSYEVDGRVFEGNDVRIGGLITTSDVAEQVIRDYPVAARVPVFVDPADPSRAVLHPALPGTLINRPFFALGAGLVLWAAVFFALLSLPSRLVAPGLTLWVPGALIVAALACLIGGVALIAVHARKRRAETADHWPTAEGVVTESEILPLTIGPGAPYAIPRIAYRFTADGRERTGHRLSQGPALMTLTEATQRAARYPVGTRVQVYRHPTDSLLTVLDPAPAASFLTYAVICGLGLITIGVVALVAPTIALAYRLLMSR